MIVFYDFETNGFPYDDGRPLSQQPHIVQAAAILADDDGKIVDSFEAISRPIKWRISASSTAVHGITYKYAKENGIQEEEVFDKIKKLMVRAEIRVGHNESFDRRILEIASERFDGGLLKKHLKEMPSICTMENSVNICKIPPTEKMKKAGYNNYKNPSLQEVYAKLFNENFSNAHNAMADVIACKAVFEELRKPKKSFWQRLFGR